MRILILGATGCLGHRLFLELSKHHEVWGTTRGKQTPSFADSERIVFDVVSDIEDDLYRAFRWVKPDVAINCIAAIPQRNASIHRAIAINAALPHALVGVCADYDARLIHFSTDGVFSGKRGNYTEDDTPDATDVYGMTKRLGEISDQKHVLTLRCCSIGREIGAKKSLVEWFLAQTGTVKGYSEAWFNPVSTHQIAHMLNDYVLPNDELHGIYHIGGGAVLNKLSMLRYLKGAYSRDIEIAPYEDSYCNRTLTTRKFYDATGYNSPTMEDMLTEMAADNALYEGEHAHG